MKQFAVFFLVVIVIFLSGGMERTLPQEKGKQSEAELKNKEVKGSATTTIIIPEAKSKGELAEESGERTESPVREKQGDSKGESEAFKKELGGKEKEKIEDLKTRFRKLIEDEMKQFGVLEEILPEEEKGEELKEEKKAGKGREVQKEVAAGKKEEEVVPEPKERGVDLEEVEEEAEEAAEEEALEEEIFEEVEEVTPAEPEKPEEVKEKITLDFEDADIKEVITALADIIGINYIINPKIRGKVNIHTSGEISKEDIFPILETIFEVNGIAAVKVGDIYKIIPVKDAKKQPLIPQIGKEVEDISSPDRLLLQIVPLRYIPPKEMEKVLKPFLGGGGVTVDYSERNILIIVDTVSNMKKLMSLVDTVDVSVFDTMHVKFYELENSEAKDLAKELENLFKALGIETKRKKGGELVSFIPIERMNIILAVSSMPEIFDKVAEWIEKLDRVREELEEQIFIYFVENAKAIDIGDIIKEVYGEKTRDRKVKTTPRTSRGKKTKTSTKVSRARTGVATVTGEVKIVVDEVNNAIIIRATPQDYAQVLKTIKLLDTIPKQVLIEVLIAEITLDEGSEFGIEWSYKGDYASLGGYKGTESLGQNIGVVKGLSPSGFTYAFVSEALESYLRAYAREAEVDILSSPHILVADNTEAKIEVGKEVPIVTSEYTPTTLEAGETYSRSIEYRDTGILLTVTPRINEKGLVAMEVNQEVSDVSEQRIEGINSPIILKRQAETTLVVQDGKTIAIGGLMREKKDSTQEGIPFLSKLPYLGMVFGYTKEVIEKTELLILITPHVVHTFEQAELITRELKEKVEGLKKILENED
jgi:general secretion pathway protein D